MENMMHKSVLLDETIKSLNIDPNKIYIDATLGYAGHSREVLKRIDKGLLIAFDQDKQAIRYSQKELDKLKKPFQIVHSNFSNLNNELNRLKIDKVAGIMFDLGVSSPQLDEGSRGFSYHSDAKLDMRMNQEDKLTAYEVVNNYEEKDLVRIFLDYGEERYAKSIAKNIVLARKKKPISRTLELVEIIKSSVPQKYKRESHPAQKVFQAIRIEVNRELEILEQSLKDAISRLEIGGRISVITFHSLEDKICKKVFKELSQIDEIVKGLPNIPKQYLPVLKLIGKYKPSLKELEENNRSRSAKLRVAEKIREKE
ncbi:MAG: 16S rRNA (cytosine(1402)-N(4))-methyltransferase RsmH [Mollicutes bacterium]|nr:16S rRNA (cytosine(1402)-N(4))-methyltransferase RsmH [Mollicutes bacterium]